MLANSRLYSFLDHKNGFNIHFLEGQKLIHDLVLMHPLKGTGFSYFRDMVLGLMPIIHFLKPLESLGIYLDSEEPYFRLKIETNNAGHTRMLLLPEDFNNFPMELTGEVRVSKIVQNKSPYTSVLSLDKLATKEVINRILSESYQVPSKVEVSEISDQSIMVTKLPALNVNKIEDEELSLNEYIKKNHVKFHDIFEQAPNDIEQIVQLFEAQGLSYLASKQIDFFCPCSKERMISNLKNMYHGKIEELMAGDAQLDIKCDYCNAQYVILENELKELN
ncbi:MAG TPA: Hsp33 family molecular chaperone HslO [Bacteriovoracaceae bacterium]|nr:Hsp33 family molecular chaperone HslO [Bacteriovoracaceae bacterium]